jgi:hypothetical protein
VLLSSLTACVLWTHLTLGVVPALVITSDGDRDILTETDILEVADLHGVPPEDMLHFGSRPFPDFTCVSNRDAGPHARAPMVTHAAEFNAAILRWIDANT